MSIDRTKLRARVRPDASWYKIKNLGGDSAEVIIYDEVGYWGVSAQDFMTELKAITASEISLRINSPGGEIFDGIAIMNALRSHSARVTTYVDSLAASIASVIAMAGDRIVMQPHSQMMIHDGMTVAFGNAAELREAADQLDRQSDNIAGIYSERAGGTAKQWRARMQAETWYSAQEAVEAGLADEVAKPARQDDQELAAKWDLSVFAYAGRTAAPAPDLAPKAPKAPEPAPVGEPAAPLTQAPDPEPAPDLPPVDADVFRAAMRTAVTSPFEFDAGHFRSSLAAQVAEAPAEPAPRLADPEPHVPAAAAPNPEPEPDPEPGFAELFRAAVELQASNAPAPTAPPPAAEPELDPYDPIVVQRALKEAIKQ